MRRVRPQRQVCNCGAYPFPHRKGGGGCGDPVKAEIYYFGESARQAQLDYEKGLEEEE